MDELQLWHDRHVLTFDGRVVETFGVPQARWHVALMRPLNLTPRKRGGYFLELRSWQAGAGPSFDSAISDEEFPQTEAFIAGINTAIATASGGG